MTLATMTAPTKTLDLPDPNDPAAVIPTAQYRSSFDRYKKMSDEAILPWKESNDLVGRIGGWRVYAREAESTDAPAPAPSTSPPPGPIGTERSRQPTAPGKAVIGTDHGSHK